MGGPSDLGHNMPGWSSLAEVLLLGEMGIK